MNILVKIKAIVKDIIVDVALIGKGATKERFFYPKGLYSNPKESKGLRIGLVKGENEGVIIPLQKQLEIAENETVLTNDTATLSLKEKEATLKGTETFNIEGDIKAAGNVDIDKNVMIKGTLNVGDSVKLDSVLSDLLDALVGMTTMGSPVSHTVDPGTIAKFQKIKADLAQIIKG